MGTIAKLTIYSVFVIICDACTIRETNERIDIEGNINNLRIIYLSHFTDNIQYVPLETRENVLLDSECKCDFLDSLLLIYDLNQCQLYSRNGKFICSIGVKGNGPDEFQFCMQACFSKHSTIFMQSNLYELNEYSLDGKLINHYNNTFRINDSEDYFIVNWLLINDSLFFGHVPNTTGKIPYKAILKNKQGDIKQEWENYDFVARTGVAFGLERNAYLHTFNNLKYFKQFYNDTLFYLNDKFELIPTFSFHLGNLKMPASIRASNFGGAELWDYISLYNVYQTTNYLFLNVGFGNRFPAKRLTAQTNIPQIGPVWYNTTHMLGIVNKNSGSFIFCKPTSTDNQLFTSGIYNDIDAGPRFFPDQMVDDSTFAMLISAENLKAHLASIDFQNSNPKYSDKKTALKNLGDNLSIMDNPILMVVVIN